ncbi:MAG TPA: phage tail protein [Bryobacteraceae bacterium]|nr:phage tail protein [Bryobacteraceae bacterium]
MGTINVVKQLAEADTPLLFFQCVLPSGDTEYWSTHSIEFNGAAYSARVLKHNLFDLQLSADDAMDGISQLSITLANADSYLSELNAALSQGTNATVGLKGTKLTVYFAFADLPSGTITTESTVLFQGVAGDPDLITEDSLTLTFSNKLSLQRIPVPEVRIQRTCPWNFPTTLPQRTEAQNGGTFGKFSRFFRCGYSADVPSGAGNLNAGQTFTSCDKSRAQCIQRGMFSQDAQGNDTRRYGGFEFVPSAITVRTAGASASHLSPLLDNSAKFNDPVPLVYGAGWLKSPVIFSRNDGNLTHMEVLLCIGTIQGVLKVVVNDIEIPLYVPGNDMTTTGWYQPVTTGTRTGNFNLDFVDSNGNPLGDPYGSVAVLSIIVPNRISTGRSLPNVQVLLQGLEIDTYNPDGSFAQTTYTNNPAWVILDLLQRCGWSTSELNLQTFASSAAFCQYFINTTDLNGNSVSVPRYECNLILTKRQSAATVIRGIRVASSLMLRYGPTGLLELLPETTIAAQQPTLPDGSNSTEMLENGWPAYEFSDGSASFSGIARNSDGSSSVRLSSRTVAETSNRLSIEFQDESNEYQQDSLSIADADDTALIGYEISSQSTALGVANFSQATRVLLRQLDKSTKGNLFIEFETSFRALKVRPGDIIAITYLKEGFERTPFRVTKLSPAMNYQAVTIQAQVHNDDWYSDNTAVLMNAGRQPSTQLQIPRPLIGTVPHTYGAAGLEFFDFGIQEEIQASRDGSASDILSVAFQQPASPSTSVTNVPLVSLSPQYSATGGTLPGYTNFYYAVTAVDSAGNEGPLSFTVPAKTLSGTNTNTITLQQLSFPQLASSFHVYRGVTPQELYRITSSPVAIAVTYADSGAAELSIGPPDASFDHANFYYRYEYAGPCQADIFSSSTIGWSDLNAQNISYAGMVARIIEGTARGQERLIASNTATTLTIIPGWSTTPDATSLFVIADGSWKFAAVSATSPAKFEIPYQRETTIQISGRAANVSNQECDADLSPLTRWTLGGMQTDVGLAAAPNFTLGVPGAGALTLSQVGFADLTNSSSITSGTLQLYAWNELLTPSPYTLANSMDATSTTVQLAQASNIVAGQVLAISSEMMTVLGTTVDGSGYLVQRGSLRSATATHSAGDSVLMLSQEALIVPFAPGFFESQASQNFLHTVSLPDQRIYAAELYMTNSFGDGKASQLCYVSSGQTGLRTLSGGQLAFQVSGFLATQQNAAPPILVQAGHSVRDIRASVTQAAAGYSIGIDLLQNASPYCSLAIAAGATTSTNIVDGLTLLPLLEGASLTMNVSLNPVVGYTGTANPAQGLTVTIRF